MNQETLDLSGHKYEEEIVDAIDFRNDTIESIEMCKTCGLAKYEHETKAERFAKLTESLDNLVDSWNKWPSVHDSKDDKLTF